MRHSGLFFKFVVLTWAASTAATAFCADLGVPLLEPSLEVSDPFGGGNVLKKGIRLQQSPDVAFEPEVGVGHGVWSREVRSGYDEITHKIHAQAGGKVDLFNLLSLSASARLPLYSVASSDRLVAGGTLTQPGDRRYDFVRSADRVSWGGELGLHLGPADVNIYYDRNRFDEFSGAGGSGLSRYEDSFGTRFIFRFK